MLRGMLEKGVEQRLVLVLRACLLRWYHCMPQHVGFWKDFMSGPCVSVLQGCCGEAGEQFGLPLAEVA